MHKNIERPQNFDNELQQCLKDARRMSDSWYLYLPMG